MLHNQYIFFINFYSFVNNNLGYFGSPDRSLTCSSTLIDATMSPPLANTDSKPSNTLHADPPSRRIAISVEDAWKQYGNGGGKKVTPVLQGLNMTVREGTM